ncbi:helix-turn-helix domain containing protein [Poseidonibacter lekithochrous]|nr:helix-turn-helix domain containing protein [Poseidonibacter lekithochrous]MDO6828064.1 helix-turn-helix domain-containing protein [Poseidonibacter sp. 1_MG-2023]
MSRQNEKNEDKMRNIDDILSRLYDKLGFFKDKEFCEKYELKQNTVSTWKKRNSIPYDLIADISQNENISLDYILNGKEEISLDIDYKKELIKNLEELNNTQIKYIWHISEAEKLKS